MTGLEKQKMVEKLKVLLGIELMSTDKDAYVAFVLDKVGDMVCNYCRIEEVPQGLKNVVLNMGVDMYRAEGLGKEEAQGAVKSITEGDVSVSFGSSTSSAEDSGMVFLRNYTAQLDRYRKAGW